MPHSRETKSLMLVHEELLEQVRKGAIARNITEEQYVKENLFLAGQLYSIFRVSIEIEHLRPH